jgi:hypothetical protein
MARRKILVVDYREESGLLLLRTMKRKFPECLVQMSADTTTALRLLAAEKFDAVVLHRTENDDAATTRLHWSSCCEEWTRSLRL